MLQLSHIVKQHSTLPAFSTIVRDANGDPVDLTGATGAIFRMHLIGDATTVATGPADIVEPGAGEVSYEFDAADTQIAGGYLAQITVTFPGGGVYTFPYNEYYLVIVEPDLSVDAFDPTTELVFATVANARSMGKDLTAEELLQAQGHIEVSCGRMIEQLTMSELSIGDQAILRKATVYQAVWLKANPDVEERTDVTKIRTAGLSGESAELTTDGIVLAPLARRLITGLSWVRSRSIKTRLKARGVGVNINTTSGGGWSDL